MTRDELNKEVIEEIEKEENKTLSNGLMGIHRSLIRMDNAVSTTEALVWLLKGDTLDLPKEKCYPLSIAEGIVQNYKILYQEKILEIDFIAKENPVVFAPPPMLRAIIDNLIRNVFQQAYDGKIRVEVNHDGLKVLNSWKGDSLTKDTLPSSNYYHMNTNNGICLDLAKGLCEILGWQLTIKTLNGQEMKVEVSFHWIMEN